MGHRLGVDVGGTFTDVQMQHSDTGEVTLVKVLSTPADQSVGVLQGVREACRRVGVGPADVQLILHGSTVVTNLILEGKGASCGLLTTRGHEQILHLARAWTPGPLYGWMGMVKPEPLAPLWHTRGIEGRLAADGSEVEALDEPAVAAAIDELLDDGVRSVTIGFLNSYVNPAHERRAREIARERHPELPVSISSDLVSEYREYERTLTAVLNAYAQPEVIRYVRRPGAAARRGGVRRPPERGALRRRDDEHPGHQGAARRHRVLRTLGRRGRRRLAGPPDRRA